MGLTEERSREKEAGRKRAAVEILARYEPALRRTARRYSLCAEDAEDAFQRAMEILLTKAPTTEARELIRWTQTVTKHEALAVRRNRERSMGGIAQSPTGEGEAVDWVTLVPAEGDGPEERVERREAIARSREALQALRPAERRALSLLAGGCSYAEIARITGFSPTKVNRSIAEGRERFRRLLTSSQDGSRCVELRSLLSAFCDGEASAEEVAELREHLRACGPCRATMRAYRATPRAVAALAPAPFAAGSLLERGREILAHLQARLPGQGGTSDSATAQVAAAGGTKGAGMAALTKVAAVCSVTAGGVACVAAGIVPAPLGVFSDDAKPPAIERSLDRSEPAERDPADEPRQEPARKPKPQPKAKPAGSKADAAEPRPEAVGAAEYTPPPEAPPPAPETAPAPAPPSETAAPSSSSGSAAGEFGP